MNQKKRKKRTKLNHTAGNKGKGMQSAAAGMCQNTAFVPRIQHKHNIGHTSISPETEVSHPAQIFLNFLGQPLEE